MQNSHHEEATPLKVWALLPLLIGVAGIIVYFFERSDARHEELSRITYAQQRVRDSAGRPVILFLGTSMTECALDSTRVMEERMAMTLGVKPVFIKIWKVAGSAESFNNMLPMLQKLHPQLLVTESNMFWYMPKKIPLMGKLLSTFNHLMKLQTYERYFPDRRPVAPYWGDQDSIGKYREGYVGPMQLAALGTFLKRLQQQGCRLALVNIPIRPPYESKKWESSDTSIFTRNLSYLKAQASFDVLPAFHFTDKTYYMDKGHMNAKGAKVYSCWLSDQIAKEMLTP